MGKGALRCLLRRKPVIDGDVLAFMSSIKSIIAVRNAWIDLFGNRETPGSSTSHWSSRFAFALLVTCRVATSTDPIQLLGTVSRSFRNESLVLTLRRTCSFSMESLACWTCCYGWVPTQRSRKTLLWIF